jgi:hypothetical protein
MLVRMRAPTMGAWAAWDDYGVLWFKDGLGEKEE